MVAADGLKVRSCSAGRGRDEVRAAYVLLPRSLNMRGEHRLGTLRFLTYIAACLAND